MNSELIKDYNMCKKIIEDRSKTFSIAFGQLPSPKKEAVWSYYAFNRRLDDIGDDEKDLEKLKEEEYRFKALLDGDIYQDYVYRTLNDVKKQFGIDKDAVMAMFSGQYKDIKGFQPDTENDLLEYCYEVAGSVGQMLLPILASKNYIKHKERLKESARLIGIGMQLTNILRDVKEDFENKRCYFSKEILTQYNLDLNKVFAKNDTKEKEKYIQVWEYYAIIAKDSYEKGIKDILLYDEDSRKILLTAVLMYAEIIKVTRKKGYGLINRAKVSKGRKLMIMKEAEQRLEELI